MYSRSKLSSKSTAKLGAGTARGGAPDRLAQGVVPSAAAWPAATASSFEPFFPGNSLRLLPDSMSGFLMASGFERHLGRVTQIACDNPAASEPTNHRSMPFPLPPVGEW